MTSLGPAPPGVLTLQRENGADPARQMTAAVTVSILLAGVIGAVALRIVVLRLPGAAAPQGLVFGVVLLALAAAAGCRLPKRSRRVVGAGIAGGAMLVLIPLALQLVNHGGMTGPVLAANGGLSAPAWLLVTLVVASGEEALLRGALFRACLRPVGTVGTILFTSALFALIHVPFYGWAVVPLDFAVGVWLGGLRIASGSAVAPAIAHSLADAAAWWL
jgi:membrane protease YdiL (CAAX protease family)